MESILIFLCLFLTVCLSGGACFVVCHVSLKRERIRSKRERRADRVAFKRFSDNLAITIEERTIELNKNLADFVNQGLEKVSIGASKDCQSMRDFAEQAASRREQEYDKVAKVVFEKLTNGDTTGKSHNSLSDRRLKQQKRILEKESKTTTIIIGNEKQEVPAV